MQFCTSLLSRLGVLLSAAPPGQPRVQDLRGGQAVLTWDRGDTAPDRTFTLQCCTLGEAGGAWLPVREGLADCLCILDSLQPGLSYSFRVVSCGAGPDSPPSPPSPPLTVPLPDLPPPGPSPSQGRSRSYTTPHGSWTSSCST